MNKDAKIFVAGASGMVGSAIVRRLLKEGYTNLVGSYRTRRPADSEFGIDADSDFYTGPLRLVKIDFSNQKAVTRFFEEKKPEFVFMAAAKVGGIHANSIFPADFVYQNLEIQNNTPAFNS